MTALLSPNAKQQFLDNAGNPAASYRLYTYAANTTDPQATYSNRAGTVANTNPIILDARGEATIYLTPGTVYDYVLKTAADVTVWTREDVIADAGDSNAVTFTPDGTGAVTRTVQRKLRNLDIDWEDFGIVADGATDDSAALELALNNCNGRRLILPHGTSASPKVIKVTRPLVLTSAIAPHLFSEGPDKTIVRYSGATLGGDLIAFVGSPRGIRIEGIKFDGNGATTVSAWGLLALQNCEDFDISFCEFVGFDKEALVLNGCRDGAIRHNKMTRTASATTFNHAMRLSSTSQQSRSLEIAHNKLTNSAMNLEGTRLHVLNNDISGWKFGGGIVIEATANSSHNVIAYNDCYGSGTQADVNGYRPGGIENWGSFTKIVGNNLYSNSGAGMDQGGQYCNVVGNTCYNNGQSGTPGSVSGGDGIVSRYADATYNASGSVYAGNTCYDSQTLKTQGYGYSDQSASLTGITLDGSNSFLGGSLTGPTNVQGALAYGQGPSLVAGAGVTPGTIANGANYSATLTLAGARLGDFCVASYLVDLQGVTLTAHVTANDTVRVVFSNTTGAGVTLAATTVRVQLTKRKNYTNY